MRSKVRRKALLAQRETEQTQCQVSASQGGLNPEERMKRINLRESLNVRVRSFLMFLQNDRPDPEKEPAQMAQWNAYIEGLNLRPGDFATYREAPPETEALVERLFAAQMGDQI